MHINLFLLLVGMLAPCIAMGVVMLVQIWLSHVIASLIVLYILIGTLS